MLATFRKYTGLMFIVLILLFVGLTFFGSSGQGITTGKPVVIAHGKKFTAEDLQRFAERPARMLKELSGEFYSTRYQAVEPFLSRMGVITHRGVQLEEGQVTSYLVNRMALHKAMDQFGVVASTAEVEQFLKETVFWEEDKFDEQAYVEFVDKSLPKLGLTVKQMNEVVGEVIALKKLQDIVGAGVDASREAVLAQYFSNSQRINYTTYEFPLAAYEGKQEPTEEELKTHWEANKAKYLSKPKRKIAYLLERPNYDALQKALPAEAPAPPEADKVADPAAPTIPPLPTLTPEQRKQAVIDLAIKFEDLLDTIEKAKGEGFAEASKASGFEVKTTELVEQDAMPAELKAEVRDDRQTTTAGMIFARQMSDEPFRNFSEIKKVGTDQWFLSQLLEAVEPSELSFEEARDLVRKDLVKEGATKAMEEAAKAKRDAFAEALKAGKSAEDAAKELELTGVPAVKATRPPARGPSPQLSAFDLASRTNPGEVSKVEVESATEEGGIDRAIFTFVEKREVIENPQLDTVIADQVAQTRDANRSLALASWFARQSAEADLSFPQRK